MSTDPQTKLGYNEPQLPGQDPHITREDTIPLNVIIGQIRRYTTASVPPWTPTGRGLDQFALRFDGFNKIFYVYDFVTTAWYGTNIS